MLVRGLNLEIHSSTLNGFPESDVATLFPHFWRTCFAILCNSHSPFFLTTCYSNLKYLQIPWNICKLTAIFFIVLKYIPKTASVCKGLFQTSLFYQTRSQMLIKQVLILHFPFFVITIVFLSFLFSPRNSYFSSICFRHDTLWFRPSTTNRSLNLPVLNVGWSTLNGTGLLAVLITLVCIVIKIPRFPTMRQTDRDYAYVFQIKINIFLYFLIRSND